MEPNPKRYVRFQDPAFGAVFLVAPGLAGELVSHAAMARGARAHADYLRMPPPLPVSAGYFTLVPATTDAAARVVILCGLYHGSESLGLKPLSDDAVELEKFLGVIGYHCDNCKSTGFQPSAKEAGSCTFCDGTEGGAS